MERQTFDYGDLQLIVNDNGFWLEDKAGNVLLDASTLGVSSTSWIEVLVPKNSNKYEYYVESYNHKSNSHKSIAFGIRRSNGNSN